MTRILPSLIRFIGRSVKLTSSESGPRRLSTWSCVAARCQSDPERRSRPVIKLRFGGTGLRESCFAVKATACTVCSAVRQRNAATRFKRLSESRGNGQKLEKKNQGSFAGYATTPGSGGAIAQSRRHDDNAATADAHGAGRLVPPANHVPATHAERKGLPSLVAGVERGPVL